METRTVGLVSLATLLTAISLTAWQANGGPAYQIVLRSRHAETHPAREKDGQTGDGSIVVEQPEPSTIVVTMTGSAAAGSGCHSSCASLNFQLEQDLEIIALRDARPPRVGMMGRVVGTLAVTKPACCSRSCGTAEQGPATATLSVGETSLLSLCVKPSTVACGQELAINFREGPVESTAATGNFRLGAAFRLGVTQGRGLFHRQFALADFAPAPQLNASFADILQPFRAAPRNEFGFKLVLRVAEERPATPTR